MKAAQYVCDTSDEEEKGKEQEEVEDPGTTHSSTARAHSVSPRAEASSIVCTKDSEKQSESYKEMVKRSLQITERRKERRRMILVYKEGDSIDPFLPTAFATGKLSAVDAATVKYYPQFIEIKRRQLLGEPSWWSFLKEGENRCIAEGELFLIWYTTAVAHFAPLQPSAERRLCRLHLHYLCFSSYSDVTVLNGIYLCSFSPRPRGV